MVLTERGIIFDFYYAGDELSCSKPILLIAEYRKITHRKIFFQLNVEKYISIGEDNKNTIK
jgi:hypothetical protein